MLLFLVLINLLACYKNYALAGEVGINCKMLSQQYTSGDILLKDFFKFIKNCHPQDSRHDESTTTFRRQKTEQKSPNTGLTYTDYLVPVVRTDLIPQATKKPTTNNRYTTINSNLIPVNLSPATVNFAQPSLSSVLSRLASGPTSGTQPAGTQSGNSMLLQPSVQQTIYPLFPTSSIKPSDSSVYITGDINKPFAAIFQKSPWTDYANYQTLLKEMGYQDGFAPTLKNAFANYQPTLPFVSKRTQPDPSLSPGGLQLPNEALKNSFAQSMSLLGQQMNGDVALKPPSGRQSMLLLQNTRSMLPPTSANLQQGASSLLTNTRLIEPNRYQASKERLIGPLLPSTALFPTTDLKPLIPETETENIDRNNLPTERDDLEDDAALLSTNQREKMMLSTYEALAPSIIESIAARSRIEDGKALLNKDLMKIDGKMIDGAPKTVAPSKLLPANEQQRGDRRDGGQTNKPQQDSSYIYDFNDSGIQMNEQTGVSKAAQWTNSTNNRLYNDIDNIKSKNRYEQLHYVDQQQNSGLYEKLRHALAKDKFMRNRDSYATAYKNPIVNSDNKVGNNNGITKTIDTMNVQGNQNGLGSILGNADLNNQQNNRLESKGSLKQNGNYIKANKNIRINNNIDNKDVDNNKLNYNNIDNNAINNRLTANQQSTLTQHLNNNNNIIKNEDLMKTNQKSSFSNNNNLEEDVNTNSAKELIDIKYSQIEDKLLNDLKIRQAELQRLEQESMDLNRDDSSNTVTLSNLNEIFSKINKDMRKRNHLQTLKNHTSNHHNETISINKETLAKYKVIAPRFYTPKKSTVLKSDVAFGRPLPPTEKRRLFDKTTVKRLTSQDDVLPNSPADINDNVYEVYDAPHIQNASEFVKIGDNDPFKRPMLNAKPTLLNARPSGAPLQNIVKNEKTLEHEISSLEDSLKNDDYMTGEASKDDSVPGYVQLPVKLGDEMITEAENELRREQLSFPRNKIFGYEKAPSPKQNLLKSRNYDQIMHEAMKRTLPKPRFDYEKLLEKKNKVPIKQRKRFDIERVNYSLRTNGNSKS